MRMPHNETGKILPFKKPTVHPLQIFELTNMLWNTEGKKVQISCPLSPKCFFPRQEDPYVTGCEGQWLVWNM